MVWGMSWPTSITLLGSHPSSLGDSMVLRDGLANLHHPTRHSRSTTMQWNSMVLRDGLANLHHPTRHSRSTTMQWNYGTIFNSGWVFKIFNKIVRTLMRASKWLIFAFIIETTFEVVLFTYAYLRYNSHMKIICKVRTLMRASKWLNELIP